MPLQNYIGSKTIKAIIVVVLATSINFSLFARNICFTGFTQSIGISAENKINNTNHFNSNVYFSGVNIHISKNTYLIFNGNHFKSNSIKGDGLVVITGTCVEMELQKVTNLELNAKITSLNSHLTVISMLEIGKACKILLNNYNLTVNPRSFNSAKDAIIKNSLGQLQLIPHLNSPIQADWITITFHRLNIPKDTCIPYSFVLRKITYALFITSDYKHLLQAPPTPPPNAYL